MQLPFVNLRLSEALGAPRSRRRTWDDDELFSIAFPSGRNHTLSASVVSNRRRSAFFQHRSEVL
jgi:hypothetical protein